VFLALLCSLNASIQSDAASCIAHQGMAWHGIRTIARLCRKLPSVFFTMFLVLTTALLLLLLLLLPPPALQEVRAGLLAGPSIIVADEAHQMKNEKSHYCRTMRRLASRRRLALTGYPLQNNLNEYYQMILWVSGRGGAESGGARGRCLGCSFVQLALGDRAVFCSNAAGAAVPAAPHTSVVAIDLV
jgi:hypothetical protein